MERQLYVYLCPPHTVWNITITKAKIILQKGLFHIITDFSNHKGIWGWAESSFGLCSSSAENLPKITLNGNCNTLTPKPATELPRVANERYLPYKSFFIKYVYKSISRGEKSKFQCAQTQTKSCGRCNFLYDSYNIV